MKICIVLNANAGKFIWMISYFEPFGFCLVHLENVPYGECSVSDSIQHRPYLCVWMNYPSTHTVSAYMHHFVSPAKIQFVNMHWMK